MDQKTDVPGVEATGPGEVAETGQVEMEQSPTVAESSSGDVQELEKGDFETDEHKAATEEAGDENKSDEVPEVGGDSVNCLYDSEPLQQQNIYEDTGSVVNPAIVESLTAGFVSRFLPSLEKARDTIGQIKSSQNVLIETVQQESVKFTDCSSMNELEKTMAKAKQYHSKLVRLRREMSALHEKSAKLKKRALRLQQQTQKDELTRAHNLEKEMEKERMLTARVAAMPD